MALLKQVSATETAATHGKVFHGLRRTPEGMLYLTVLSVGFTCKMRDGFAEKLHLR